jgi:hypothetical protein
VIEVFDFFDDGSPVGVVFEVGSCFEVFPEIGWEFALVTESTRILAGPDELSEVPVLPVLDFTGDWELERDSRCESGDCFQEGSSLHSFSPSGGGFFPLLLRRGNPRYLTRA